MGSTNLAEQGRRRGEGRQYQTQATRALKRFTEHQSQKATGDIFYPRRANREYSNGAGKLTITIRGGTNYDGMTHYKLA
jgi:hypothetical protein